MEISYSTEAFEHLTGVRIGRRGNTYPSYILMHKSEPTYAYFIDDSVVLQTIRSTVVRAAFKMS